MTLWPANIFGDLYQLASIPVALKDPVFVTGSGKTIFLVLVFHNSVITYSALAGHMFMLL